MSWTLLYSSIREDHSPLLTLHLLLHICLIVWLTMVTDLMTTLPISNPPFSSSSTILSMYISYFSSSARFCWWIFAHLIIPERGGGDRRLSWSCCTVFIRWERYNDLISGGGLGWGVVRYYASMILGPQSRPTNSDGSKVLWSEETNINSFLFLLLPRVFWRMFSCVDGKWGAEGENVPHTTRNI